MVSLWYRLIGRLVYRARRGIIAANIASKVVAEAGLVCGPNAVIYNHGLRSNVRLGTRVVLDGILECFTRGRLKVGEFSYVGRSRVFAAQQVEIGRGVMISDHVVIMDSDLHPLSASKRLKDMIAWTHGVPFDVYTGIESRPVFVRDGVWIGANAVVLKGVTVGRGAIVGAGSVVTKDVPEYTVVAGNPARTIRELGAELR